MFRSMSQFKMGTMAAQRKLFLVCEGKTLSEHIDRGLDEEQAGVADKYGMSSSEIALMDNVMQRDLSYNTAVSSRG